MLRTHSTNRSNLADGNCRREMNLPGRMPAMRFGIAPASRFRLGCEFHAQAWQLCEALGGIAGKLEVRSRILGPGQVQAVFVDAPDDCRPPRLRGRGSARPHAFQGCPGDKGDALAHGQTMG
jgi:hypothetical protein